jgi:hypothetical protein
MIAARNLALLTLASALGLPCALFAQPPKDRNSPRAYNQAPPAGMNAGQPMLKDNEEMLDDLRRFLDPNYKRPTPKDVDPKLLKDLMEKMKGKEGQEQIEKMLNDNPSFRDPEFLKQLGKMKEAEDFPRNFEQRLPPDVRPPTENKEVFKENLKQVIESGQKQMWPEGGPKGGPPKMEPGGPNAPKSTDPSAGNASENEWVKFMQKHFGESDAGKSAINDLMSALGKQDSKGMFDNIPEFKNGGWKDFDSWGKANAGDLWKMKPPDMSGTKMTGPKMGGSGSSGGSSFGGGGGSSGGSLGGAGGGLGGAATPLAIIAAIAAGIFLAVLLLRKWKLNREQKAAGVMSGKDGIDFDSIRTREQLVTAFDHVSLDQIGEEARTWNHRVIADEFAETRPVYAEPANELAGLYERARYAPLDEDLTTGEFSDARRDLRTIAGVTL